jgi:O-antigen ligase
MHDPTQLHGLHDAADQASRFTYIFLTLPLWDWLSRSRPKVRHYLWFIPIMILCAVTWSLFVAYLLGADYGYGGRVGPFRGTIGSTTTGDFRAFIINDVIFIPGAVFALSSVRVSGMNARRSLALLVILSSAFLANARGIWIGLCVGTVILFVLSVPKGKLRRLLGGSLALTLLAGLVISAAPQVARPVVDMVTGGPNEVSTSGRLEQGPQLVAGFKAHPIIGSGFGAWLATGYRRSADTPWSFELAYLQLLFQLGVVGLACLISAILPVVLAAWRRMVATCREERALALGGISSLAGYLFACAGNPYLLTSVGMFSLGISLALCSARFPSPRDTSAVHPPTATHAAHVMEDHAQTLSPRERGVLDVAEP